ERHVQQYVGDDVRERNAVAHAFQERPRRVFRHAPAGEWEHGAVDDQAHTDGDQCPAQTVGVCGCCIAAAVTINLQCHYKRTQPCLSRRATTMPKTKAMPMFHSANAATVSDTKRSFLVLPKSQLPSASCAPVMNSMTPSTGRGKKRSKVVTESLRNNATRIRMTPRMMSAPPVRAPKRTWPAMPPAP